jgi:hypothetical protein
MDYYSMIDMLYRRSTNRGFLISSKIEDFVNLNSTLENLYYLKNPTPAYIATAVPISTAYSDVFEHIWQQGYKPNTVIKPTLQKASGSTTKPIVCFQSYENYRVVELETPTSTGKKWIDSLNP